MKIWKSVFKNHISETIYMADLASFETEINLDYNFFQIKINGKIVIFIFL